MRVFEVITEHCKHDSKKITKTIMYVTSHKNTIKSVVDHYTKHCDEYSKELKGVREVLSVIQHIPAEGKL